MRIKVEDDILSALGETVEEFNQKQALFRIDAFYSCHDRSVLMIGKNNPVIGTDGNSYAEEAYRQDKRKVYIANSALSLALEDYMGIDEKTGDYKYDSHISCFRRIYEGLTAKKAKVDNELSHLQQNSEAKSQSEGKAESQGDIGSGPYASLVKVFLNVDSKQDTIIPPRLIPIIVNTDLNRLLNRVEVNKIICDIKISKMNREVAQEKGKMDCNFERMTELFQNLQKETEKKRLLEQLTNNLKQVMANFQKVKHDIFSHSSLGLEGMDLSEDGKEEKGTDTDGTDPLVKQLLKGTDLKELLPYPKAFINLEKGTVIQNPAIDKSGKSFDYKVPDKKRIKGFSKYTENKALKQAIQQYEAHRKKLSDLLQEVLAATKKQTEMRKQASKKQTGINLEQERVVEAIRMVKAEIGKDVTFSLKNIDPERHNQMIQLLKLEHKLNAVTRERQQKSEQLKAKRDLKNSAMGECKELAEKISKIDSTLSRIEVEYNQKVLEIKNKISQEVSKSNFAESQKLSQLGHTEKENYLKQVKALKDEKTNLSRDLESRQKLIKSYDLEMSNVEKEIASLSESLEELSFTINIGYADLQPIQEPKEEKHTVSAGMAFLQKLASEMTTTTKVKALTLKELKASRNLYDQLTDSTQDDRGRSVLTKQQELVIYLQRMLEGAKKGIIPISEIREEIFTVPKNKFSDTAIIAAVKTNNPVIVRLCFELINLNGFHANDYQYCMLQVDGREFRSTPLHRAVIGKEVLEAYVGELIHGVKAGKLTMSDIDSLYEARTHKGHCTAIIFAMRSIDRSRKEFIANDVEIYDPELAFSFLVQTRRLLEERCLSPEAALRTLILQNYHGYTALHSICMHNDENLFRRFIELVMDLCVDDFDIQMRVLANAKTKSQFQLVPHFKYVTFQCPINEFLSIYWDEPGQIESQPHSGGKHARDFDPKYDNESTTKKRPKVVTKREKQQHELEQNNGGDWLPEYSAMDSASSQTEMYHQPRPSNYQTYHVDEQHDFEEKETFYDLGAGESQTNSYAQEPDGMRYSYEANYPFQAKTETDSYQSRDRNPQFFQPGPAIERPRFSLSESPRVKDERMSPKSTSGDPRFFSRDARRLPKREGQFPVPGYTKGYDPKDGFGFS